LQHDDTLADDTGYIWQQDAAFTAGCAAAIAFPISTGGATVSLEISGLRKWLKYSLVIKYLK